VPSPHVQASSVQAFNLPLGYRILHAQLLESGKLLLILEDPQILYIFLDSPSVLYHAVSHGRNSAKRTLHRDKIGNDVILSYDEQKRMLSICAASKVCISPIFWDPIIEFEPSCRYTSTYLTKLSTPSKAGGASSTLSRGMPREPSLFSRLSSVVTKRFSLLIRAGKPESFP
jgi:hypothetical protein